MTKPEPKCDDPDCPGWLHVADSMGSGPAIERCDSCSVYDDDETADQVHDAECGCKWSEVVRREAA